MAAVLLSISLMVILVVGVTIAKHFEKKEFNKGYCKKCNNQLRHFDNDSQGGRGYICDNCKKVVWVSYKVDKEFQM